MEAMPFPQDGAAQFAWLTDQEARLNLAGPAFSWWPHDSLPGFRLVVTGPERSMELHLKKSGELSRHLEASDGSGDFIVLVSDVLQVATFAEFERAYVEIKDRVLAVS